MARAILDTNVFVAAGFNPNSASARLLRRVRDGRMQLIWNEATRRETRAVLMRIPMLSWEAVEDLFRPEGQGPDAALDDMAFVEDPKDRKFAALSLATQVPLVTADDHLLVHRGRLDVARPSEFLRRQRQAEDT